MPRLIVSEKCQLTARDPVGIQHVGDGACLDGGKRQDLWHPRLVHDAVAR